MPDTNTSDGGHLNALIRDWIRERQVRLDDLDDSLLERCIWCGAWSIEPTCRYCSGRAVSDDDAGVLGAGHDPDL